MRRALACTALVVALGAGLPGRAAALLPPELTGGIGGTFGAAHGPAGGGLSLGLSALWRFDGPFAFGPMVFADDLGTEVGRLFDANDGTDIGASERGHRLTYGAAWRVDAEGPIAARRWRPFAGITWGAYRLQADHLGVPKDAVSATGASVAAGVRYVTGRHHGDGVPRAAFGVSYRYHRVFNDRVDGYSSVAVDWSWPLGAGAPQAAGK